MGGYSVALSPGSNIVHISVSAELGHFRSYSLNVFRGGSLPTATLPSGAQLSSLRLTADAEVVEFPGEEVEGEDCGCATYYRVVVPKNVSRLSLAATPKSGVRIETQFRTGSRRSGATRNVSLREGRNELIVLVYRTGNNPGRALEVYRVMIIRAGSPPKLKDATVTREGNVLLRYDRTLLPDIPGQRRTPGSAFEVMVDRTFVQVTRTDVTQKWLHLTLRRPAGPDAQVRVRYRIPSSNPVQSGKFGLAAEFSNKVARYAGSGLLVFDATANEAPGATVDFKVMMLPAPVRRASVDYATSDDTADAGADYTATSGTLIFEVGEIHKTISVPVIDDDVEDNGETFTLTLSNPINAFLGDATATGTIYNHDPEVLTASFGGTPEAHGGEPFVLLLQFSEPVGVGWGTMNVQLLSVTNGRVARARRVDRERDPLTDKVLSALWEITIEPSGGDVTVELPATADCGASLAVCTRDDRPLSAEATVAIPQGVGLLSATVNADAVVLTFDEALDEASVPAAAAFTVRVGGVARGLAAPVGGMAQLLAARDPVTVSGSTVTLTLASPVDHGETVTVDYTMPTVNPLRDLAGVAAVAFNGQSVTNHTPDTTGPELLSATASWDAVVLTFDEALDEASVPAATAFTVHVGGVARGLAARDPVRVSGSTVTLKFESPATHGETVTVDYAVPFLSPLRDLVGVAAAAATVETVVPEAAFTVRFEEGSVPETHDGVNRVAFRIVFSEEPAKIGGRWVSEALREAVVVRIGGDRIYPRDIERLDATSRRRWQMKVRFLGGFALATEDLTIELGPTSDCADEDALCTGDRRPLSNRISARIRYAPSLSVAGAQATEATDATIDFTVTLSRAASKQVTVDYATSDETATAGADYTASSGTLTFAPGETEQTVSVVVLDDGDSEGLETLTLTLSNASGAGAVIRVASATGTIADDEPPEESGDPLTAAFRDISVETHDGSTFTFELRFSEDVTDLSYVTLRDHAFTVTNGQVTAVVRLVEGKSQRWEITVEPDGNDAVTIELPATTDCGDTGAICIGNRPLSAAVSATVPGPAPEAEQQDAGDPLTAAFRDISVETHDGSATFTFELRFSEDVTDLSHVTLRDHAFTVTNGQVTAVARLAEGKNQRWEITIEPDGNADVTIELPATTDCGDTGAICIGNRPLSAAVTATVPGPAPETKQQTGDPLTAAFRDMSVETHDGSATFTFELRFSEDVTDLSYVTLRDHAFTVTNGQVTAVARLAEGKNQRWEITVEPDGNADVTIELPATTDCGDTGAICIGNRPLSAAVSVTVPGPAPEAEQQAEQQDAGTPLTAAFRDMSVETHDGSATFTFELRFSEDVTDLSYVTLRDHAFTVTNGQVTAVARLAEGKNQRWEITVEPDGNADVTIELPATTDCDDTGAICIGNRPLSAAVTVTIPGPAPETENPAPLTAAFRDMSVETHDGSATFTFELRFSEDVTDLSYVTLRDHAFTVTNGQVTAVARTDADGDEPNREWEITVEPDGNADVTIELPATTDCGDTGAICIGNRPLSAAVSVTVPGPAPAKLLALADGPLLLQNVPNPFNSQTVLSWFLLKPGPTRLEVFALTGQRVAVLHQGPQQAGLHRLHWEGRDEQGRPLASGIYISRLATAERVLTQKLILLR